MLGHVSHFTDCVCTHQHVPILHNRLWCMGNSHRTTLSSILALGQESRTSKRSNQRCHRDCSSCVLFVRYRTEYSGANFTVCQCGSDTLLSLVAHQLGRKNVLLRERHACEGAHYDTQRRTWPN